MALPQRIFKLKGVVQHYSWGGYHFIPQLLGLENSGQKPFAEYWVGAHPNYPSLLENGSSLTTLINNNMEAALGKQAAEKYSSLPYLFKILDVRQMLSIQVHPSKTEAEKGFEEEEKKGIAVNAVHRNYKDRNHKPEMMVALGDFWLLHGFKKKEDLRQTFGRTPELAGLNEIFERGGYKGLYEEVMLMEQHRADQILKPLIERILPLYKNNYLKKDEEDFWAARAALNFCKEGHYDRGIFSIYLFNLVHLKKGEGIFQPAGMPHAYLEGQNVEVMANSDNVLRAGLTDKHIDVAELMKHVQFEATDPRVINPHSKQRVFSSPAEEFELHQYDLAEKDAIRLSTKSAELFFILKGHVKASNDTEGKTGEGFFVLAGTDFSLLPLCETVLFRITVPGI